MEDSSNNNNVGPSKPELDKKTETNLTNLFKKLATASGPSEQASLLESWKKNKGLDNDFMLRWAITKEIIIAGARGENPDIDTIKAIIAEDYDYLGFEDSDVTDELFKECTAMAKEIEKQKGFGILKSKVKNMASDYVGRIGLMNLAFGLVSAGAIVGWSFAIARTHSRGLKAFAVISIIASVLTIAFSIPPAAYGMKKNLEKDRTTFGANTKAYWLKRADGLCDTAKAFGVDLVKMYFDMAEKQFINDANNNPSDKEIKQQLEGIKQLKKANEKLEFKLSSLLEAGSDAMDIADSFLNIKNKGSGKLNLEKGVEVQDNMIQLKDVFNMLKNPDSDNQRALQALLQPMLSKGHGIDIDLTKFFLPSGKIPTQVQNVFKEYGVDITNISKHKLAMKAYRDACEDSGLHPMYLVLKETIKCVDKTTQIMAAQSKSQGKGQSQ